MDTDRDILIDGYKAAGPDFMALQTFSLFATSEEVNLAVRDHMIRLVRSLVGGRMHRLERDIAALILANMERDPQDESA